MTPLQTGLVDDVGGRGVTDGIGIVDNTVWVAVSVTVSMAVDLGVDVTVVVAGEGIGSHLGAEATFTMTNSANKAAGIINHASLLLRPAP